MRSDEILGEQRVPGIKRSRKKTKKTRSKTSKRIPNRRSTLLLRKIRSAPGARIRKKICTVCKKMKWLSEFYIRKKDTPDAAYKSDCKECDKRTNNERKQKKNRSRKSRVVDPRYQEYQKNYYHSHKEKFKEYQKKFLEKNPLYFVMKSRERKARLRKQAQNAKFALKDEDCL